MAPAQYAVGGKVEVHIDSDDGTLIGETPMLPKSASMTAPPTQLHAPLKPTTGMHDVYFVFKNERTPGMIMIALTATFVNGRARWRPRPPRRPAASARAGTDSGPESE